MYGVGIEKCIQNGRGKKSREINSCMGIHGNVILHKDPQTGYPQISWLVMVFYHSHRNSNLDNRQDKKFDSCLTSFTNVNSKQVRHEHKLEDWANLHNTDLRKTIFCIQNQKHRQDSQK